MVGCFVCCLVVTNRRIKWIFYIGQGIHRGKRHTAVCDKGRHTRLCPHTLNSIWIRLLKWAVVFIVAVSLAFWSLFRNCVPHTIHHEYFFYAQTKRAHGSHSQAFSKILRSIKKYHRHSKRFSVWFDYIVISHWL